MKAGSIVIEWDANGKATFVAPMGNADDRARSVQMLAHTILQLVAPQPSTILIPPKMPLEKRG
jgi:hypothetical protein